MSLLTKPRVTTRWKKTLLFVVSLLLLVPCVAAAAFNMRFEVAAQDVLPQDQRRTQAEQELERKMNSADILKDKIARDPQFRGELERRREVELEMREVRQAALVRLARINMDQAIQIASSQQPGKVMSANLDAKGWEEPGKLAKDGVVFYHVEIADEINNGSTHVIINAIDGTVMKTEKELPRKQRIP